jgi:hypothetical protein
MDIVLNGIHYIKLDEVIPAHVKKCYSIEFQQNLQWLIAQNEPVKREDLNNILIQVLNEMSQNNKTF